MKKEVAVGTVVQETQRGNDACHPRWERTRRAELFERYGALRAQGTSQRQAAQLLNVPRSTLQAWQAYQESLDESPAVVAFFHSPAGLAFLHRLVLAFRLVCIEVGTCGIRYKPPDYTGNGGSVRSWGSPRSTALALKASMA